VCVCVRVCVRVAPVYCYDKSVCISLILGVYVKPVAPTPWGTGGTCPHFYKWLGTGGTVSRKTANKKLTKLY